MIFETIVMMSAISGILLLLIFILRFVTIRVFPVAWNYYVSIVVIAFLLVPVGNIFGRISNQWMTSAHISIVPQTRISDMLFVSSKNTQHENVKASTDSIVQQSVLETKRIIYMEDFLRFLPYIWLLGMVVFIAYKGTHFFIFKRKLLETSLPVEQDCNTYKIYQACKLNMGITQQITLLSNGNINTPILAGLVKTFLILPEVEMTKQELNFIFYHELTHYKRKDLWVKTVALFANVLHWFNPLVFRMVHYIDNLSEMSCDEVVVRNMTMKERRFYGETILNVLSRVISKQEGIYSTLCETKKGIKRRLTLIMKKRSYSKKVTAVSNGIFMVVCLTGVVLACAFSPSVGNSISAQNTPSEININPELKGNGIELMDDWNWKNSLDEMNNKALFADIALEDVTKVEKENQYQLVMDQFFTTLSQNQKATIKEKDIETLTFPVPNGRITSCFGNRIHPISKTQKFHSGVDFAQKMGSDIVAANDGKVIATSEDLGGIEYYGNYLIVAHQNGTATLYAHCRALMVNTGDRVKKGDKIAEVGSTGCATGAHCHFEFRVNGEAVNPMEYIDI
ncbi:MAG: M23/M56 family metallopeptidase [Clostridia bacterium]|nr:M23/M56 family metallopeptidase [Clostridia bacterium]MDD4049040.1 M23/M56 family metallopeptidase [Clostridia bacterium]